MKKYNIKNYIRYRDDVMSCIERIPENNGEWSLYSRDELIAKFLPLVENLARKFSTAPQASGVMDITDLIQEGSKGLIQAVDKIDFEMIDTSLDPEKTIKSFLAKRIKGAIRRGIDINRGTMRIPEHKINEMRKSDGDTKAVELFFNSIFSSLDELNENGAGYDVADVELYKGEMLTSYLLNLMSIHLSNRETEVLVLSYGLNCDKQPAREIAKRIGIDGNSAYVRISQLKSLALSKLIDNVKYSQVIDFL